MEIVNEGSGLSLSYNGVTEFVAYNSIKTISPLQLRGDFYIVLHFTTEIVDSLKINLAKVTNQPTWTNDVVGIQTAVDDIINWIGLSGTAMPFVTGQTVSYATGDDGGEQQGRDFFELDENNHFGNKWRFTGVTGGYYDRDTSQFKDIDGVVTTKILAFPNYIVCDHATKQKISGDDSILIHYMGGSSWLGIHNMDWSTAVAYNTTVNSIAPAGFNDKWFLVNERQARLLTHNGNMRYEPFSIGHGSCFIITSTSASDTPGSSFALNYYMRINLWVGGSEPISKSTAGNVAIYAFYTRITKLSEL